MATGLKDKVLHGGNLPPFVDLDSLTDAQVCRVSKRKLNLVTISVHGHSATLQAVVMRNYINLVDALKEKNIIIFPISTYRSCATQKDVCNSVCPGSPGCAGCSGYCGACGGSVHQWGAAIDSHISRHPHRSINQAYKAYIKEAKNHDLHNFSGGTLGGTDPYHLSYKVTE